MIEIDPRKHCGQYIRHRAHRWAEKHQACEPLVRECPGQEIDISYEEYERRVPPLQPERDVGGRWV